MSERISKHNSREGRARRNGKCQRRAARKAAAKTRNQQRRRR